MTCPLCEEKTKVIDSRPNLDSVWRRRECTACGYKFNTVEMDEDMQVRQAKKLELLRFRVVLDRATGKVRIIKEAEK